MRVNVSETKAFEQEIARLNKRAHKVGLTPIRYSIVERKQMSKTYVCVEHRDGEQAEQRETVPVDVTVYEINLPSVDDYKWRMIAKITPLDDGKIYVESSVKGFDKTPYETGDACRCEHCNIRRARSMTYVVQNKETSKFMQVGRNCFADYVGHAGLAKLEFIDLVVSQFSGDGEEDFIFPGFGGRVSATVSVRELITYAEDIYNREGWRNNVKESDGYNTWIVKDGTHRVAAARHANYKDAWNLEEAKKRHEALMTDPALQAQVTRVIETLRDMELAEDDEFGRMLQYCMNFERVPSKKASTVAYAGQFLRSEAEKAAWKAKKASMKHVGTLGKREEFVLTVKKLVSIPDYGWGPSTLHIFEDANGNALTWKTRDEIAKEGETLTLKGTVKEHSEYNGAPQTKLARCKLVAGPVKAV